jgi:transcriptional regulator with GAF, ATPase, and Fis domain
MSTDPIIAPQSDSHRYEAVLRISEAIAACEIGEFLHFEHLYFVVVKENSQEIEYLVWGKGPLPFPELPIEELLPLWEAVRSSDPQRTANWDTEERYPRFKPWAKKMGLGSGVRIPLTTPHRHLGVFGLIRDTVNPFSEEEISFLGLIGRVAAFALDDGLNLRRAQHQNDQLQLLLDLTSRITSNLELRDLLRAIAANIREVIRADAVDVALPDAVSDKFRVFAMDFPHGKGLIKEELLVTPSAAVKKALDTLKPVVVDMRERNELTSEAADILAAEGIKTFAIFHLQIAAGPSGFCQFYARRRLPFRRETSISSAGRQARLPSPLKTRWHIKRFRNSKTSLPRRSSISKKKSAAR